PSPSNQPASGSRGDYAWTLLCSSIRMPAHRRAVHATAPTNAARTRTRTGEVSLKERLRRNPELAIESCQAVLHCVLARNGRLQPQRLQRKRARLLEIADAMLVMDRQCFARLARICRRALPRAEQLAPCRRGFFVPAQASQQ